MTHRTQSEEHEMVVLMSIMFNIYGLANTLISTLFEYSVSDRVDKDAKWFAERYIFLKRKKAYEPNK